MGLHVGGALEVPLLPSNAFWHRLDAMWGTVSARKWGLFLYIYT